jgi:hypothetical protein
MKWGVFLQFDHESKRQWVFAAARWSKDNCEYCVTYFSWQAKTKASLRGVSQRAPCADATVLSGISNYERKW